MNHKYVVSMSNHGIAGSKHLSNHDNEDLTKNLVSSPKTSIYIENAIPFCRAHQYALVIILLLCEQCINFMLCQPVCSRIIVYLYSILYN